MTAAISGDNVDPDHLGDMETRVSFIMAV